MTIETFPITIYTKVKSITDPENVIHYPAVQILFDDTVLLEQTLVPTDSDQARSKLEEIDSENTISVINFNVELDDDIDTSHTLTLNILYDAELIDSIKQIDPETGHHEDFGFYIQDIELNEISIENLVYDLGSVNVPLCIESDYENDGFIQQYLIPENLTENLQLIDEKYWYITNGDYIHMPNSSYSIEFKTPLYLWLLELLLQ